MGPAGGHEVECTACGSRFQVKGKGTYEVQRHWDIKHKDRLSKGETASSRMVAEGSSKIDSLKLWHLTKKSKEAGNKDEEENQIGVMEMGEEHSKKRGLQNLFCRNLRCFVAQSLLSRFTRFSCGEKFNQKLCLWRKKDKYQV